MKNLLYLICTLIAAQSISAQTPLQIDINRASARPLVVGIVRDPAGAELDSISRTAEQELRDLLTFTELFQVIAPDAKPVTGSAESSAIPGFSTEETQKWSAVGCEMLVRISAKKFRSDGAALELRAADLNQRRSIIAESYPVALNANIDQTIKTFINHLLESYTGQPGIFTKMAFVGRENRHSTKQIFIADIDGRNAKQITSANSVHLSPSISPDGRKVLYTSYQNGNPDLYMYDLVTGNTQVMSKTRGLNSGGTFAQNGQAIVFTGSVQGDSQLYLADPLVPLKRKLLLGGPGIDVDPTFSPDGRFLAYVSGRYGNPHIFRAELTWIKPNLPKVVGEKRLTFVGWYNATPAWSPDSQKIAFAGFDRDVGRFDLFIMNSDGTNMERLTLKRGDNENPSFSPNGQQILFHSNRRGDSNIKGQSQIYIMNKDGGNQRHIDVGLWWAETPAWAGASPKVLQVSAL